MNIRFTQVSKTWYGKTLLDSEEFIDEFSIQLCEDDNCSVVKSEFSVQFHDVSGICAKICVFDDAIDALIACEGMFAIMALRKGWTPEDFYELLRSLKYKDITQTVRGDEKNLKKETVKEQLGPMVEKLANTIDWSKNSVTIITVGLFIKDKEFFVASIGAGTPDDERLIGATIYGTSSVSIKDETPDHYETADMLLVDFDQFLYGLEKENKSR